MNRTNTRKNIIALVALVALVAILGICLVACNANSYKSKLENKGYHVETVTSEKEGAAIEWSVMGTKGGLAGTGIGGDSVTVTKYKNESDAKDMESSLKKTVGEKRVYRTGKIVITGTEQGVKDAK